MGLHAPFAKVISSPPTGRAEYLFLMLKDLILQKRSESLSKVSMR